MKWAIGKETPLHHGPPKDKPAWTRYLSVDYSHKVIGIQYGSLAIFTGIVALVLSLIFRTQIGFPGTLEMVTPYSYYQFVTMTS